MADIRIDPVNTSPVYPAAPNAGNAARAQQNAAADRSQDNKVQTPDDDKTKVSEKELEDVIAVSRDGDTVQASEISKERLEEDAFGKMVVNEEKEEDNRLEEERKEEVKEEAVKEENREEAQEKYDTAQNNMTYAGYTDAQLEQMYLKGDISKNDYDKEMEAREERLETEQEEDSANSERMVRLGAMAEDSERDAMELENAFSPDSSDTISGADRMAVIEALDSATGPYTGADDSGEESAKRVIVM